MRTALITVYSSASSMSYWSPLALYRSGTLPTTVFTHLSWTSRSSTRRSLCHMELNTFVSNSASLAVPDAWALPSGLPAPANCSTRRRLPDDGVAILRGKYDNCSYSTASSMFRLLNDG